MTLRFGTDGVRGHAEELTDQLVTALGRAAARVLAPELRTSPSDRFVIGRDPRDSGPRIEAALVAGLAAEGVASELVGVAPTPAIAWTAAARGVPAAMISASHNPFHDNGIKFFAAGGRKLTDEIESRLEGALDELVDQPAPARRALEAESGRGDLERYELALLASIEDRTLAGVRVAVDCANGAASEVGPRVLERAGATVHVVNASPNGRNINEQCGSTHPEALVAAVSSSGAAIGLAFDGDADRVLAVDEKGAVVDGDHLIALCARDLRRRGRLHDDTVVVTVMTNLGFRLAMAEDGIEVVETQVGDRYVLEALEAGGYSLGGEQSGHVIFRDLATTGDGLLTGLQVLDLMARDGRPFSVMVAEAMTSVPQVLKNVTVPRRDPTLVASIGVDVAEVERELGDTGRVLVRASGTEPLVRVMVEALDADQAEAAAERLVRVVEQALRA
jgi:phosphoglucosamine mutase